MSNAEAVAVILSGIVPLLVAIAGLLWWAYRRGVVRGKEVARYEAVERLQAETAVQITTLRQALAETRSELTETRAELGVSQLRRKRPIRLPE